MTSLPEVNSSHQQNITCTKDGGLNQNRVWLLSYVFTFTVGLVINVLVAYTASRWRLLQSRLRNFRSLSYALVGQLLSGALSCSGGLGIVLTALASRFDHLTPEVLCRAGAALPQLVLTSATAVAVIFVFRHCDEVTCCGRLHDMLSTVHKVTPVIVGLTTAAVALADPTSGNWLDDACTTDDYATYRLPTVLAAVCFIACGTGAFLILLNHVALRGPTRKRKKVVAVPLMELNTTDNDGGGAGGHVTSGDVIAAQQTCRMSYEAAAMTSRQDADDVGSWRCSSKMGYTSIIIIIIIIIISCSKMGLPSMTSLLRSKSSLKSSQKSVVVKVKTRRTDDDEHCQEDSCEVKMRRLFQRRRAAACRRHTVANIPAPDGSVPAERRSSDDAAGQKSRDPGSVEPYQYQYVRQWSVDVAALAEQLQNPKAHLSTSGITLASRQQVCDASGDTNTGTVILLTDRW